MDRKYFMMNFQKLRDFWHASAVKCFLKAKSRAVNTAVPPSEYLLYKRCENEAGSVAELAGCVVILLDARDKLRSSQLVHDLSDSNTANFPFIPGFEYLNEEVRKWLEQLQLSLTKPTTTSDYKLKQIKKPLIPATVTYREPHKSLTDLNVVIHSGAHGSSSRQYVRAKQHYRSLISRCVAGQLRPCAKQNDRPIKYTKLYISSTKKSRNGQKSAAKLTRLHDTKRHENSSSSSAVNKARMKRQLSNFVKNQLNMEQLNSALAKLATAYITTLFGGHPNNVTMKNIQKLQILSEYYRKVDVINTFVERMNTMNTRFLRAADMPIENYVGKLKNAKNEPLLQNIVDTLNSFQEIMNGKSISVMSPRFFSTVRENRYRRHRLLSPTVFSFQRDGLLSISELFQIADSTSTQRYLIELLLELSGASTAIDKLFNGTEWSRRQLDSIQYPAISKLISYESNWEKALKSCSEEQASHLNSRGYAYLTSEQLYLIYGAEAADRLQLDMDRYVGMSEDEKEEMIEAKIRALAQLTKEQAVSANIQKTRFKRHHRQNETEHGPFHTFETIAFSSYIGYGSALEVLTLSPYAFLLELLYPEAIGVRTLSPSAFAASILSPTALTALILSPTAFRAEVLSPRALTPLVLSPEAITAEVLSPHLIQPRVLSPETLVINVLNPDILSPRAGSGISYSILVLSPEVLSPRVWSKDNMVIEVLSPHILGGGEHEEEEEREEEKTRLVKKVENSNREQDTENVRRLGEQLSTGPERNALHSSTTNWNA